MPTEIVPLTEVELVNAELFSWFGGNMTFSPIGLVSVKTPSRTFCGLEFCVWYTISSFWREAIGEKNFGDSLDLEGLVSYVRLLLLNIEFLYFKFVNLKS